MPLGLQQLQPLPQSALPSSSLVARLPTQPQPRATLAGGTTARLVQLPTQPIPQNRVAQISTRQSAPMTLVRGNLPPGARIVRTLTVPNTRQVNNKKVCQNSARAKKCVNKVCQKQKAQLRETTDM
jgi:hypothetical protein